MHKENYVDPWLTTRDEDRERSYSLETSRDLDPLLDRIGNAHFVLLGEATHGTHEFYTWRTAITKRLIEEKGFEFIAVEGDWPDCYLINRYIKGYETTDTDERKLLSRFDRWPSWMWANWEIAALLSWLKEFNAAQSMIKRVGFYGLDVYSLFESMEAMVGYLRRNDPQAAALAEKALECFEFYGDEQDYASQVRSITGSCHESVVNLLQSIRKRALNYDSDPEAILNMEQNAHIAVNAESYYRNMVGLDSMTWNIRDTHMAETLNRLRDFHGKESKCIIWEHNTHIGDARYTDMKKAGMVNVGQLIREQYGMKDTVLVGFGSWRGQVVAGKKWGAPMQVMDLPEAKEGSIEAILHDESGENRILIFDRHNKHERFSQKIPHRAVGVVYDPLQEKYRNYVPSIVNHRYDAFIYIDETKALHPLPGNVDSHKVPETFPFEY